MQEGKTNTHTITMKNAILILIIAAGGLTSFDATATVATTQLQENITVSENNAGPRRPGGTGLRRMRNKMFTVNVGHYNKKIMVKYDREMKALALAAKSGKEKRADRKAKRVMMRIA